MEVGKGSMLIILQEVIRPMGMQKKNEILPFALAQDF